MIPGSDIKKLEELLNNPNLSERDEQILDSLLTASKDINPNISLGPDNVPVLIYALRKGNIKVAEILIKHGADKKCLSEKQPPKNKSLLYAMTERTALSPMLEKDKEIIYFLLDNDVNLNVGAIFEGKEDTVMQVARRLRNTVFIKIIHEYYARKNENVYEVMEKTRLDDESFHHYEVLKESGHVLGFATQIAGIKSEGYDDLESFNLLKYYLDILSTSGVAPLLNKHYSEENSSIREALDLAINWLKADGTVTHQNILDRCNSGKMTILPVSAAWHSFTLIVCNDILIVCNRGDGQLEKPINLFKIPEPGELTKKFLEEVLPETGYSRLADAVQSIKTFLDIPRNQPLMTFSSSEQKHGTCAFVNIKAALYPMLFLSELLEVSPLSDSVLDSTFIFRHKTMVQLSSILQEVLDSTLIAYKALTDDMRNQKVNELCNAFKGADVKERAFYFEIFKAILIEHHGQPSLRTHRTEKMRNEKRRAEQLLNILSPIEKHVIITAILSDYTAKGKTPHHYVKAWLEGQLAAEKENISTTTPLYNQFKPEAEQNPTLVSSSKPKMS